MRHRGPAPSEAVVETGQITEAGGLVVFVSPHERRSLVALQRVARWGLVELYEPAQTPMNRRLGAADSSATVQLELGHGMLNEIEIAVRVHGRHTYAQKGRPPH